MLSSAPRRAADLKKCNCDELPWQTDLAEEVIYERNWEHLHAICRGRLSQAFCLLFTRHEGSEAKHDASAIAFMKKYIA